MKKIVIVLVAFLALTSCNQQKIGFVNSETIMEDYQKVKDVEADLKAKSEKAKKDLDTQVQAFQAKVMAYQKAVKTMSAKARQQKEQALTQEQQMLQQKQQQVQYQAQTDGQEAIKKIAEDVNDFIKDYGKKNGYQLVLGTVNLNGAVMYGDDKIDLTKIIVKGLNDAYSGDTKKEEAPAKSDTKEATKKEDKKETTKK